MVGVHLRLDLAGSAADSRRRSGKGG